MVSSILVTLLALAAGVSAGSIKDIKHVVLFMQENRAFDHVGLLFICVRFNNLITHSTSEQWLAFVDSPIPMSSSIPQQISPPSNSKLCIQTPRFFTDKCNRKVNDGLSTEATSLLPFYINYLGSNWTEASQCASGGSNSWFNNHLALNGDLNDQWAWTTLPCPGRTSKDKTSHFILLSLKGGHWRICIRYVDYSMIFKIL